MRSYPQSSSISVKQKRQMKPQAATGPTKSNREEAFKELIVGTNWALQTKGSSSTRQPHAQLPSVIVKLDEKMNSD